MYHFSFHFTLLFLSFLLPLSVYAAEDFYKLLGVPRDVTERELKKAFVNIIKKNHPDKNPNDPKANEKFVALREAYDTLLDPKLRSVYDESGYEGVQAYKKTGRKRSDSPFDSFFRFFDQDGFDDDDDDIPRRRRGPDTQIKLAVPLRDFYNGNVIKFSLPRKCTCKACDGTGSKDGKHTTCKACGGRGVKIQRQMLIPGVVQHFQTTCDVCHGKGKVIRTPCPVCKGKQVVEQMKEHEFKVLRGMPDGIQIKLAGMSDENPDWEPGDVIVELEETEPTVSNNESERTDGAFFRRRGIDLYWREVLSLREAWMGEWTRQLKHLDGHIVKLSRKRGEVVQPGMVEVIANEGMPIFEGESYEPEGYGKLYIEYTVIIPDKMKGSMEKEFWNLWEKWRTNEPVEQVKQDL